MPFFPNMPAINYKTALICVVCLSMIAILFYDVPETALECQTSRRRVEAKRQNMILTAMLRGGWATKEILFPLNHINQATSASGNSTSTVGATKKRSPEEITKMLDAYRARVEAFNKQKEAGISDEVVESFARVDK